MNTHKPVFVKLEQKVSACCNSQFSRDMERRVDVKIVCGKNLLGMDMSGMVEKGCLCCVSQCVCREE